MFPVNPCKECVPPKRTPECHCTCSEYLKWKADLKVRNDAIRKKRALENMYIEDNKRRRRRGC